VFTLRTCGQRVAAGDILPEGLTSDVFQSLVDEASAQAEQLAPPLSPGSPSGLAPTSGWQGNPVFSPSPHSEAASPLTALRPYPGWAGNRDPDAVVRLLTFQTQPTGAPPAPAVHTSVPQQIDLEMEGTTDASGALLALLGAASGKRYGGVEGRAFLEWDKGVMRKITDTRMQWRKASMDLPFTDMAQVYVSMAESGSGFKSHISILLSTFSLEAADATRGMFPVEAYTVAQLTAGLDPFQTTGPRRDCLDREWQAAYGQVATLATAQNRLAAAPSATAAASTAAGVQPPVQGGGLLSFIDGLGRDHHHVTP